MTSELLQGRFVHLDPVSEDHRDLVYELAVDSAIAHQWIFRGETPVTRDSAFSLTLHGSLASFVVVSNRSGRVAGLIKTHSHDYRNQRVAIAMAHRAELRGVGWPLEGTALMIDWLFANWPFRKVTAITVDHTASNTSKGVGRFFHEEAYIPDLMYWNDRRWGLHLYAVYRDEWAKLSARRRGRSPSGAQEPRP